MTPIPEAIQDIFLFFSKSFVDNFFGKNENALAVRCVQFSNWYGIAITLGFLQKRVFKNILQEMLE